MLAEDGVFNLTAGLSYQIFGIRHMVEDNQASGEVRQVVPNQSDRNIPHQVSLIDKSQFQHALNCGDNNQGPVGPKP